MPNQPKTPVRSVRIDDELWAAIGEEAKRTEMPVSDVVRAALRKHLGLIALVALLLSGCGAANAATPAAHRPVAEWNGTHGLTAASAIQAVADTAPSTSPAPKPYGSWNCATPMTFHPAVAPGIDVGTVYRELEYPVAYLNALGYRASIGAQAPYVHNAEQPTETGSITVVVAKDRADQAELDSDHELRAVSLFSQAKGNKSAAIVIHEERGLAGDIILHEMGHVLGLDHEAGTVMAASGVSVATFDADETASIICH